MKKALRKLNFDKLISVNVPDVTAYSYNEYKANGGEHKSINGYCTSCEQKACSNSKDDDSYKLTNISHGAHSSDFLQACRIKQDTSDWHQEPIMFVYETPSRNYDDMYKEVRYNGFDKQPSKTWYWIDSDRDYITYPEGFKGGAYGAFVWSASYAHFWCMSRVSEVAHPML